MNSTGQTLIYLAGGLAVGAGVIYVYDRYHPTTPKTVVKTIRGTPVRRTVVRTAQGHTVTRTIIRTQQHTVTRTPYHTPVHTPVTVIPTLTLTVNGSQFRTNESAAITTQAGKSITGLGGLVQIVDLTTGEIRLSQSYGSAFTVKVTSSTQSTQKFQARFLKNGQVLSHSNTVSATLDGVGGHGPCR